MGLGMEPRASFMLEEQSTTELCPQALVFLLFEAGVSSSTTLNAPDLV